LTFPNADGSSGQILQTDGSGTLSFTTPSSGISTGKAIAMALVFG
jgi:succinate dehydrogenase/fumarate reductase flavoprotein subunit